GHVELDTTATRRCERSVPTREHRERESSTPRACVHAWEHLPRRYRPEYQHIKVLEFSAGFRASDTRPLGGATVEGMSRHSSSSRSRITRRGRAEPVRDAN